MEKAALEGLRVLEDSKLNISWQSAHTGLHYMSVANKLRYLIISHVVFM